MHFYIFGAVLAPVRELSFLQTAQAKRRQHKRVGAQQKRERKRDDLYYR